MDRIIRPHGLIPARLADVLTTRIAATFAAIALASTYFLVWFVRRTYSALDDDAHLYALQALARLRPELGADLFLAYGSQDKYTIFTPCYAWLIDSIGLAPAEALLTTIFHAWCAAAVWFIARRFTTSELAWLAAGIVVVVPGNYGSRGVFEYAETFLTARLPAEALILTSLALALAERRWPAYLFALLALLVHPIVVTPGIGLLSLLVCPSHLRVRLIAGGAAVCAILVATAYRGFIPQLDLMDADWFEVVRDRSFFMFLDTWAVSDWDWTALTLLTLAFVAMTSTTQTLRNVAVNGVVIGVAGLLMAGITTLVPVEILLKGQPWRWMWLCTCLAVITFVPTWVACCKRDSVSRLTCVMLYSAWIFPLTWAYPGLVAAPIAGLALVIYGTRHRICAPYMKYLKWLTLGVAAMAALSAVMAALSLLQLDFTTNREGLILERARNLFALTLPAIAAVVVAWLATVRFRLAVSTLALVGLTASALIIIVPRAYIAWTSSAYHYSYPSFDSWRTAIDHKRNVLWLSNPVAVWLLLDSPSYLSVSQSAGVVFSRGTALEVKRRAAVLTPLAGHSKLAISNKEKGRPRALTKEILHRICTDPKLGYVVSADEIDIVHLDAPKGRWEHMHLYSCDQVERSH